MRIDREPERRAAEARSTLHGVRLAGHDPVLGPFGVATIVTSVAFLLAGVAFPEAAEALLRLLLATLALGFVVARVYESLLPAKMTQNAYSPFAGDGAPRRRPAAPVAVHELAAELGAANDPRRARRTPIPWSVRWSLSEEAARRLADHHGLRLGEPRHHPAIRSLVSGPTWSLIEPGKTGSRAGVPSMGNGRIVPLSRLPLILDDLERL